MEREKTVLLDSMVLLATVLEGDPLSPVSMRILEAVQNGRLKAACSVVSLQETAYVMKREGRKPEEIKEALRLLLAIPNLEWLPLTPAVFERAAEWMPRYGIALSDSLIAATLVENGLGALVTTDDDYGRLKFVKAIRPAEAAGF